MSPSCALPRGLLVWSPSHLSVTVSEFSCPPFFQFPRPLPKMRQTAYNLIITIDSSLTYMICFPVSSLTPHSFLSLLSTNLSHVGIRRRSGTTTRRRAPQIRRALKEGPTTYFKTPADSGDKLFANEVPTRTLPSTIRDEGFATPSIDL